MKRVVLFDYTGDKANDLKIARRLARKLLGAQRAGECILFDCENVEVSPEVLEILRKESYPDKIRFCGLPIPDQDGSRALRRRSRRRR